MPERGPSEGRSDTSTVRRAEDGGAAFGAKHQTELARLIEEPYFQRGEASTRLENLTRQAYEPLQRLIEADASARAAWVDLRKHRLDDLQKRISSRDVRRTFGGPAVTSLLPELHAGINVFAPPYDFPVQGPNHGEVDIETNRLTGTFSVSLHWGKGGARFATAGVGLALEAGATGIAHVRPAWHYDYQAIAYGSILGSHTEGAAKVVVQDAVTGALLKEKMQPLWKHDNDVWEDQDGYVDSWALGADFLVQAGQMFTVSFLAVAMVDDSGTDYWFGWSLAKAFMEMRIPFVVVELGPS